MVASRHDGRNDGVVSTVGLVVGVAAASVSDDALLASGVAALIAGALSMAVGEYVSVSSQRDSHWPSSPTNSAS